MTPMLVSKEVREICRIGRTTLYNRTNPDSPGFDREFPHPLKLGPRRNVWNASELKDYMNGKAAARTNFTGE